MGVTEVGGGDGQLTKRGDVQISDYVRNLEKIGNLNAGINTNSLIFVKVKKIS